MANRIKRKESITAQRQEQILKAALSVFSAKGYGESSMADVAEEAGVGVGTLYNYYKNKRDLLISLVQKLMVSEGLVNVLDKMADQGSRDFMDALLEDRLEFGLGNAQAVLFLFFEIQRDARLRHQYVRDVVGPLLARIEDYISLQARRGNFRKVDEKIVARTMMGAIIGSMILYRLEQRESPFKKGHLKEAAHELSGIFMNGLVRK
jgi:AcrR family transcriptional regulator